MAAPFMTREHATTVVTTVVSLALLAGSMLAGAVWYLAGDINAVAVADSLAREKQYQLFQDAHMLMTQRITTLEAERTEDHNGIDRLSTVVDQERAAVNDLATAVKMLQTSVDNTKTRR
jgi:uncharacterized coiled-coil protein SlyX